MVDKGDAKELTSFAEALGKSRSAVDGLRLPPGWLWATIILAARSVIASAKTSRG